MTLRILFTLALLSSTALAQSYPSPTFQGLALQADPTAPNQAIRKGYLDSRLSAALPSLSTCMLLGGSGTAGAAQGLALGSGLTCSAGTLGLAIGSAAGQVAAGNDSRILGAVQGAGGNASALMATAANAPKARSVAAVFADRVNLLDYAACDGITDDAAALTTALGVAAAIPGGAMLEVPQRQCLLASTVSVSIGALRHVHIRGAGGMSGFVTTNGSGIAVTLTDGTAGFDASDLAFMRTGSGQTGVALSVQATTTQIHTISHYRHLLISSIGGGFWQEGLKLIGVSAPVIEGLRFQGPSGTGSTSGYGLHLTGADTSHYLTDAKISDSLLQGGQAGIQVDGAVQGVFVTNSEMIGNDYGIQGGDADPAGGNLIELVIATNNHFNNTIAGISLTRVNQNQITNNLFLHFNPAAGRLWRAIFADTSGWNVVAQNGLVGQAIMGANAGGERFYETAGVSSFHTVSGNNVVGLVGYCINTSSATNAMISGNMCQAVTPPGVLMGGASFASANLVNGVNALVGAYSAAATVAADLSMTGTVTAVTPAADTNTTQLATTAFVLGQGGAAAPAMNGTAAAGSSTRFARADHVHPTDTTRAPVASPTFTGTVTIPAGAAISGYAPLASPALTGTPTAPTAAGGTSTTQVATTAFVAAAVGAVPQATLPVTAASCSSAQALAFPASGNAAYDVTLTGNCAFSLTGGTAGQYQTVTLILRQDSTAGRSPTLPAGVKWPGGTAPTPNTTAGGIDVFTFATPDARTTVIGGYGG